MNETIALIFAGVVALCTIIYSILTNKLVKETKLSREFHLEAHMIAYLDCSEASPNNVNLIIKNIGNGIARNLRFNIIRDLRYDDCNKLNNIGIFFKNLEFFPSQHENKYFIINLKDDYQNKIQDYFEFEIIYDDAILKNKKQKIKLEFKDVKGIGKLTPPDTYLGLISYRLEKIEKILEKN